MRGSVAAVLLVPLLAGATPPSEKHEKIGRPLITFYWVVDESWSRYDGKESAVLRDVRGKVIAHTTPRFKRDLIMQGSGWLKDGRTLIYMQKVDGESRFRVTSSKYGLGSTGCPLVPYRTIAVDPRYVKLGTRLYIPQLEGAKLPDGTIHDGMFIALDRGRFRGAHIDLFVGVGASGARPFTSKGYHSRAHVTVYDAGRARGCR